MAARKRDRGARPAAGAAAGHEGTPAADQLRRQRRKIQHAFGSAFAEQLDQVAGIKREAEASVALDKDPEARTYSVEHCEAKAAALAAMRAGTYWPKGCEPREGRPLGAPPEHVDVGRGRALASTPPADLGGVRTVTSQAEADALLGEGALRFPAAMAEHGLALQPDGSVEVDFDPLRNYAPPKHMHAGKPGLYLDVDLNAAPPLKAVSLDPDRSWQQGGDPISDIQAGIRAQHEAWARGAPAQTREQAEEMVAKLEQVLLGPDLERAELIRSLDAAAERIEQRLDAEVIGPLRAELKAMRTDRDQWRALVEQQATSDGIEIVDLRVQLSSAQQTVRNIAERFRFLGVPLRNTELDELLALVVGSYPRGERVIRGLGVDPGYAHLGFVAVDFGESFVRVVHREKLTTTTDDLDDVRLDRIADKANALIWQLAPHFVAYENVAAVHAGREQMRAQGKGKPGKSRANASARRQLEVSGMIRSATRRYGCSGYTVMPASARRGVLGKGNTAGATKRDVRAAVERILGVRGLSLELSDAAAIVLAGYGKHLAATKPKGRRRR